MFLWEGLKQLWADGLESIATFLKDKTDFIVGQFQRILDFIKKEEKTTQKEIRKHFPSSEAKISLVIAELEKKGLVDKIKKGRGNVIVLK